VVGGGGVFCFLFAWFFFLGSLKAGSVKGVGGGFGVGVGMFFFGGIGARCGGGLFGEFFWGCVAPGGGGGRSVWGGGCWLVLCGFLEQPSSVPDRPAADKI